MDKDNSNHYRIESGGRHRMTKPMTKKDAIAAAYECSGTGELVSVETMEGAEVISFIRR